MARPFKTTHPECPLDSEAARIAVAALVTQHAELIEWEIRLAERAESLSNQEVELAERLEGQRQQLVALHHQIGQARQKLREKRSALALMSAEQEVELDAIGRQVVDREARVQRREARLIRLWSHFKRRLLDHRARIKVEESKIAAERVKQEEELIAARQSLTCEQRCAFTALGLARQQLLADRAELDNKQAAVHAQETLIAREKRDLALREKAHLAKTREFSERQSREHRQREDLNREIARLTAQGALLRTAALVSRRFPSVKVSHGAESEISAPTANKLTRHDDQQRILTEQALRFCQSQLDWQRESAELLCGLDQLRVQQDLREQKLRLRESSQLTAESGIQEQRDLLKRWALRLESDRLRAEADIGSVRADLERERLKIESAHRRLGLREKSLHDLYRLWGRRRRLEIDVLRNWQKRHQAAYEEWSSLRDVWRRGRLRLMQQQQEVAARQRALDEFQSELLGATTKPQTAKRLIERHRRQWSAVCARESRELQRLSARLAADAGGADTRFQLLLEKERALIGQVHVWEQQRGAHEARQLLAADLRFAQGLERVELNALLDNYRKQIGALRRELESMAQLVMELPATAKAA